MNSDRIEGTAENLAGKAQQGFGEVIGSEEQKLKGMAREASGRMHEAAGRMHEAYDEARDYAQHAGERVVRRVEQQPVTSLLIVGAIGYVLGLLTARR